MLEGGDWELGVEGVNVAKIILNRELSHRNDTSKGACCDWLEIQESILQVE